MTTHVFIVNKDSFPIHLQYLFAGTGAGEKSEHIGLLADIKRVRPGDNVIFYLERVGFYGVFRVADEKNYVFIDTSSPTYLEQDLKKKLIYRVKIVPDKIYPNGVSEWEALDKLPLYAQDVIWSLIYRKLKGNRGCTPITLDESERLITMIKEKNKNILPRPLKNQSLTWDENNLKIKIVNQEFNYTGKKGNSPNLIVEMIKRDKTKRAFEDVLQAYFTENIGKDKGLDKISGLKEEIIWLGNEVSCGVGMQKIDIFTITTDERNNREFRIIELKDESLYPEILNQVWRYVNWTTSYLKGAINSNIQPIIIAKTVERKTKYTNNPKPTKEWKNREATIKAIKEFNKLNLAKLIKVWEYHFKDTKIIFDEIKY